jgi:hypothetical protein
MAQEIVRPEDLAAKLKDKVTHRIRDAFVDLISDEQWKSMTKSALEMFTQRNHKVGYAHADPSPFDKLVQEAVKDVLVERIKQELSDPGYYEGGWAAFGPEPGDTVKEIVRELAPDLVKNLFGQIVQQCVSNLRNHLQNGNIW